MKRRYLSTIILLVLLLGSGANLLVRYALASHQRETAADVSSPENQGVGLPTLSETGTGVSSLAPAPTGNLLRNACFEDDGRIPAPWKGKNLTLKDRRVCNTARYGSCSFRMVGTRARKSLRQVVRTSGSAGARFTLSGWSRARNPSREGGAYCLVAKVFHTDGTKKSYRTCFAKRTHDWQYRSKTFTVAKDYNKIVVLLLYNGQSGRAWFDDVGLVASPSLLEVNDFLYQLQNLNLRAIGKTAYDLVVIDYSADGSEEGEFTAAQIAALKRSSGGEKIVLAYMSIGEAEDYRFYWQSGWTPGNPAWLDVENPDWPGNYKVHYWHPDWQAIIFDYTDRLLDPGFDGAYLDLVDAYEYYEEQGRAKAAKEMADFVAAIRAHARARDPDFYIFPQNAPELATRVSAYLNSVDGIGQEDIYYGYKDDDVMTPPKVTAKMEKYLDVFKNAGKLVLTVDYATTPAHIDDAYAKSQAKGYVPFVTVRDLNQLTINPGHEPD